MDNNLLEKIVSLTEDKYLSGQIYKEKFDKYLDFYCKVNDSYDEFSKVKQGLLLLKGNALVLDLFIEGSNVKKSKRKRISEVFGISRDKITGDFSTFLNSKSNYEVFVDDFRYSALVSSDKLSHLNIIWGNADFRKLHNLENLENLKVVMGDVYITDAINVGGLSHLEVVTGDLHMEQLDCIDFLENLSYVGGKIYTRDGIIGIKTVEKVKSK